MLKSFVFNNLKLIFFLILFSLIPTPPAISLETDFEAKEQLAYEIEKLLGNFQPDNVPGNATRAMRKILVLAEESPLGFDITRSYLQGYLTHPNHQTRQYVMQTLYALQHQSYLDEGTFRQSILNILTEGLIDDDIRENANFSMDRLYDAAIATNELHNAVVRKLEDTLESENYQQRQYVTWILADIYRETGISESDWHAQCLQNLVEGLRDDAYFVEFANADIFFNILLGMEGDYSVPFLEAELANGDEQSRFCAAVLLACINKNTVQPQLNIELLSHLSDDFWIHNEIAAYRALAMLGPENLNHLLLNQSESLDFQQAAYLCFLAVRYEVRWHPPEHILETWTDRIQVEGCTRSLVALYLCAEDTFHFYDKPMPKALERLQYLSFSLITTTEKLAWLEQSYWFLNPAGQYEGTPEEFSMPWLAILCAPTNETCGC